jgi:L-threonylcarbamoyladenylate synthase
MPNQPMFLKLLDLGRTAYAAPSANPYKQLSPVSAEQVMAGLGGKIAAIVDGGFCTVGVESTILDLSQMPYRILRRGPLSRSELQQAGGVDIESPEIHDVAVSGNVQDHYQPKTPLHLVSRSELAVHRAKNLPNAAYLSISADGVSSGGPLHVDMPNNPAGYAKLLYKTLYELDKQRPAVIWCETPVGEQWEYILDRLRKASSNY